MPMFPATRLCQSSLGEVAMRKNRWCEPITAGLILASAPVAALAQPASLVTPDNFIRAETDRALADEIMLNHSFGKFNHRRELLPLNQQVMPRVNRDTLYSTAVFDLDAGPATISMPDANGRFMTMIVIDEDHYVHGIYYEAGSHTLTKDNIGTRYVFVAFRTMVDPQNRDDLKAVHVLQDAVRVEQPGGPGTFVVPNWDQAGLKKIRDALLALNSTLPDLRHAFGSKAEVDEVRHLIGTASAWGGNPDKDAIYLNVTPARNDGQTVYKLNVNDVPVDAFWSVTVYNVEGYIEANSLKAYNLNSITAHKDADRSITVRFGGCGGKIANCLPIISAWNYVVRLYRPRAEILDGTWKFPEAIPVEAASRALQ
jgi:hypothetical protein